MWEKAVGFGHRCQMKTPGHPVHALLLDNSSLVLEAHLTASWKKD